MHKKRLSMKQKHTIDPGNESRVNLHYAYGFGNLLHPKYSILCLLSVASSCTSEKNTPKPPNIICIVCEDISPLLGCYGDTVALTPNIDKLASEGVLFTNMFSVSGVCAPSRHALITGMYPSGTGGNNMRTSAKRRVANMPDSLQIIPYECTPPPHVKCYTEFLRKAGYYCTNNDKEDYQFNAPKAAWDESGRNATWKNRPEGMPFFAIFNLIRTHESQVFNWLDEPEIISPDSVNLPPYYPDTYAIRRDIAQVYTNITIMDREVGELIDELEQANLLDETIIIFYSDNGGPLPRGKREILDSGLKVPFMIRFPGKENAGTVVSDLCSFVDIPPTILSLAGIEVPEYMNGKAFWGDQKSEPREYIFAARDRMDEWFDCRRAVRDKNFKYIRNYRPEFPAYMELEYQKGLKSMQELLVMRDSGLLNEDQIYWFRKTKDSDELYDLKNDPFELHNIALKPEYSVELERLKKVMDLWLQQIDDKGLRFYNEIDLVKNMWPGMVQPETLSPEIKINKNEAFISSDTEGASIVYQINHKGYTPNHWFIYSEPFSVNQGDTVSALAHRIGYKESVVMEVINP